MQTLPIRLTPGQGCHAAFVLSGIGSLSTAGLRLAGTVAFDGARSSSHLQMALSTATGQVLGGHVAAGCTVRTTAEVLLALLPGWAFTPEPDAATGFDELVVRVRS